MITRIVNPRGYAHPGQQKIIAIDFSDVANVTYTLGCTVETDNQRLFNGRPTTKITVNNGTTNAEIGVATNTAQFPAGWQYQTERNRMQVTFSGRGIAYCLGITQYIGVATGYTSYLNGGPSLVTRTRALAVKDHWTTDARQTLYAETGTPAPGPNVFAKLRFPLDGTQPDGTNIWVGEWATFPRSRPKVVITLDDGWDMQYTFAFPEFVARGIPASFAPISGSVGLTNYMTVAQVQEISAHTSGDYDIVNHSCNANTLLDIGAENLLDNIDTARTQIEDWTGRTTGNLVTYPAGATDDIVIAGLMKRGYWAAREVGANDRSGLTTPYKEADATVDRTSLFDLPAGGKMSNTTSLSAMKTYITRAIARGGTFFLLGHKFGTVADSTTWTEADFTALLDWLVTQRKRGALDILSFAQWYTGLDGSNPRDAANRLTATGRITA